MGRSLIALFGVFSVLASPPVEPQSRQTVTAWTNGRWFDGTSFQRVNVYSLDDRLSLSPPASVDRTVDLGGAYVTPAFVEAHNHNIPGTTDDAMIPRYLTEGIFYVMIQENVPAARSRLAARVNRSNCVDVAFANGAFTSPGGHPTALVPRNIDAGSMSPADLAGGFLIPVGSESDLESAWHRYLATRPDFVKLILAYSEDRLAGRPRPEGSDRHGLDPPLAAAVVAAAHAAGLRVSAHVESAVDFDVAVAAGADLVAHMPGFWMDPARIAARGPDVYKITEASAERAGRQGMTVITTLSGVLQYSESVSADIRDGILGILRHNLSVLQRHQVRLAIGSDEFRGTSIGEARAILAAGLMSPPGLLRALSSDGAAAIFPARAPFGLAEGAPADFLVLDGSPLADFDAITRITRRVKGCADLTVPNRGLR
jgi:imidazolonepropionase-like amidohydrolase